jgi:aminopeptidase N
MARILFFLLMMHFFLGCRTTPPVIVNLPEVKVNGNSESKNDLYRKSYTKYADLVHTRLNIRPDWKKKQLIGEAAIIMQPHFYPLDSILLNARGMEIKEIAMLSGAQHHQLRFSYDSTLIHIHLDRTYSKEESFTIYISYISKPEELEEGGSMAITNDKGLYFIDADSLDADRPTEVWTQGETESNSVWFPTIEDPAQKMTQEIYITVDTAFTTLSNGLLISSINNNDGTKTDYWKQSLPASPYLSMIAAGKFSVVHDSWKNIDVSYYVDPPYEKFAQMIFGHTPEMLTFFSEKLGVPFYWEKYSQVVVHDYVSGAMENTTAVVHGTNMEQDSSDYLDGNYEDYISHEMFHHWFGDLVTCESWSNIVLNEGFADYAEYLWREYKFGRDNADEHYRRELNTYLYLANDNDPPLFRSTYSDREDVYDVISYNKGGLTLHMLRKYVGDEAFFSALKLYLSSHLFSSAEVADLRIAFEKITGEDLNWFFDEWFLKGGHPSLEISYDWNDSLHRETVRVKQKQDLNKNPLYTIPLKIDLYYDSKIEYKKIILSEVNQEFIFDLPLKPDLVNVDAEKMLICNRSDNKSNKELIFQYDHAPLFSDRYEAVNKIGSDYKINTPEAKLIRKALDDKYEGIRLAALDNIRELALNDTGDIKEKIKLLSVNDSSVDVREKALSCLGLYFSYNEFSNLFSDALKDKSYKVKARAFKIISDKDPERAKTIAPVLEKDSGNAVVSRLSEYYSNSKEDKNEFYHNAMRFCDTYNRYRVIRNYTTYLKITENLSIVKLGTDILFDYAHRPSSKAYRSALVNALKEIESSLKKKINDLQNNIANTTDSIQKTELLSQESELRSFRNNLHEKISSID